MSCFLRVLSEIDIKYLLAEILRTGNGITQDIYYFWQTFMTGFVILYNRTVGDVASIYIFSNSNSFERLLMKLKV